MSNKNTDVRTFEKVLLKENEEMIEIIELTVNAITLYPSS